jgi:hypothetical protein
LKKFLKKFKIGTHLAEGKTAPDRKSFLDFRKDG